MKLIINAYVVYAWMSSGKTVWTHNMRLYHFTSLDNWKSIEGSGLILKKNTVVNGKNILMLTKQADRHCQLWAMGEHRGKTEVRLTIDTLAWEGLKLPKESDEIQRLVQLGAMDIGVYGLTGKSVDIFDYSTSEMNWFCVSGLGRATVYDVKIWSEKSRRYAPIKMTPKEEIEHLRDKISEHARSSNPYEDEEYYADWYTLRWNDYYSDRIEKLEEIILSNEIKGLQV